MSKALVTFFTDCPINNCKVCSKSSQPSKIIIHLEAVHLNIRHYCDKCDHKAGFSTAGDLAKHDKKEHVKDDVGKCKECQKEFYTTADYNNHCHWICGDCGTLVSYKNNITDHKALHPEMGEKNSKAVESTFTDGPSCFQVLTDGEILMKQAHERYGTPNTRESADYYSYSYIKQTMQPPVNMREFVEAKAWEGKGQTDRDDNSKLEIKCGCTKKIVENYAKFRQEGTVLLNHRFWTNLSPAMPSLIEAAKLSAIGPWNMLNQVHGEKASWKALGWNGTQLSKAGSYLLNEERKQYTVFSLK